ncbi:Rep1 [Hyposoter didymator ichnovirus]|nr:Rep1 [Hyposoter didymator ichnovirus]
MNRRVHARRRASTSCPVLTLQRIKLPIIVILKLAKFLRFEDYYNFVRALWPNMDVCGAIRAQLWSSSEHRFTTTFINGKQLHIRYNYNPYRSSENRLLIYRDSLLPIFGGIVLSSMSYFVNMEDLYNFVRMHVHLNKCSNYRYASCPCHVRYDGRRRDWRLNRFTVDNCRFGHFHHYCAEHVLYWLHFYLETTIVLRANGTDQLHAEGAENFLVFLDDIIYFQEGHLRIWKPQH